MIFGMVFIICCVTSLSPTGYCPLARARTTYLWREIKGREDFSLDIKARRSGIAAKSHLQPEDLRSEDELHPGFGIYF